MLEFFYFHRIILYSTAVSDSTKGKNERRGREERERGENEESEVVGARERG